MTVGVRPEKLSLHEDEPARDGQRELARPRPGRRRLVQRSQHAVHGRGPGPRRDHVVFAQNMAFGPMVNVGRRSLGLLAGRATVSGWMTTLHRVPQSIGRRHRDDRRPEARAVHGARGGLAWQSPRSSGGHPGRAAAERARRPIALLLLLPGILYLALFFLVPLVSLVMTSLQASAEFGDIGEYQTHSAGRTTRKSSPCTASTSSARSSTRCCHGVRPAVQLPAGLFHRGDDRAVAAAAEAHAGHGDRAVLHQFPAAHAGVEADALG